MQRWPTWLLFASLGLWAPRAQALASQDGGKGIPLHATAGDSLEGLTAPVFEVRARRIERQESLDRKPQFATVIEASQWSAGVISASTVLGALVGVNVRESGGVGGSGTVSIRGAGAGQVPVYLDGVPLSSPGNSVVDLADVNLAMLDRIEVYRSGAPVVIGGSSLGGAIHLYSARDARPWIQVTAGSHDTHKVEAAGSTELGGWDLTARGRWIESDGDWEFFDDRGTLYNPDDDAWRRRINNDVQGGGLLLSLQRPGAWTWRVAEVIDARDHGVPGLSIRQSDVARSGNWTHQGRVSLTRGRGLRGRWQSASLFHRLEHQEFSDPQGDLGLGRADRTDVVHTVGADATGSFGGAPVTSWRLEASWSRLRGEDALQAVSQGEPQTRAMASAAWQPTFDLAQGRLQLSPGARGEVLHDVFHGTPAYANLPTGPRENNTTWDWSAQIGARLRIVDEVFLKGNLGRYTRVPTLLEQFGFRAGLMGNPDLRPETGVNRDLGLVWQRPRAGRRVELTLFDNDQFDLIQYRRVSAGLVRAANLGRASMRGVEGDLDSGWLGPVRQQVNLTVLSALDRTDDAVAGGKRLPDRPRYELSYQLRLGWRRFELGYDLDALGPRFAESGERTPIPSRALHGLTATVRLDRLRWDLRLDNLADTASFDLWGYPLPGRTFSLSLSTGGTHAP